MGRLAEHAPGTLQAFQPFARDVATVPVFMSSMLQSPLISVAFDKYDKVLILTANSKTLEPQKQVLMNECGFDVDDDRFVIVGCQDVPGSMAFAAPLPLLLPFLACALRSGAIPSRGVGMEDGVRAIVARPLHVAGAIAQDLSPLICA